MLRCASARACVWTKGVAFSPQPDGRRCRPARRQARRARFLRTIHGLTTNPEIAYATNPANSTVAGWYASAAMTMTNAKIARNGTLRRRLIALKLQYLRFDTIARPANTVIAHATQRTPSGSIR